MSNNENPIKMIVPVILAGGIVTCLWPRSRELYPKQLLALVNRSTMLQDTVFRTRGITGIVAPLVICNEEHRFMVAEQIRQTGVTPSAVIVEPFGRNTAPAAAFAALETKKYGQNPILLVLPADHAIADTAAFHKAVEAVRSYAEAGKLVTFGVLPKGPETGYGYIRVDRHDPDADAHMVAAFVEKPDRSTAEQYVKSGDYFWNSGIFMFKADSYLTELEKYQPAMVALLPEGLWMASSKRQRR
jgi:mannose-1-phosphate guanylyltransferase / mannose-6-phosphate isomerase